MRIEDAIQQEVIEDITSKTVINIMYTSSWYGHALTRMLKPYRISWQQFNILRILKGQKGKPASLRLVTERMIDQMSNTSRLIDKLVTKGLVERRECPRDRRQVDLFLTSEGDDVVAKARDTVDKETHKLLGHLSKAQFEQLNSLLDELRSN